MGTKTKDKCGLGTGAGGSNKGQVTEQRAPQETTVAYKKTSNYEERGQKKESEFQ